MLFDIILKGLSPSLTRLSADAGVFSETEGLLMLGDKKADRGDYIYVGSPQQVLRAIEEHDSQGFLTLFSAGDHDSLAQVQMGYGIRLVIVDMSLPALINYLLSTLDEYWRLSRQFACIAVTPHSLPDFLDLAYRLLGAGAYLFNNFGSLLLRAGKGEGNSPHNEIWNIISGCAGNGNGVATAIPIPAKVYFDTLEPPGGTRLFPTLVFPNSSLEKEAFSEVFFRYARDHILKYIERQNQTLFGNKDMNVFLQSLLRTPDELGTIERQLDKLYAKGEYVRFAIFSFSDGCRLDNVISSLKSIFRTNYVTYFDGLVTAMFSDPQQLLVPKYDEEAINALLAGENGYGVISNAARWVRGIRTMYVQSAETLALYPMLASENDPRLFFFDDMFNYYIIHLCSEHILKNYEHTRLIYLCRPDVIELARYDCKNRGNLREFLLDYITCGCSISKAAGRLHMHRNTVIYKLNRIDSIINADLNDYATRAGILFSCQLLRYMERVQKIFLDTQVLMET